MSAYNLIASLNITFRITPTEQDWLSIARMPGLGADLCARGNITLVAFVFVNLFKQVFHRIHYL